MARLNLFDSGIEVLTKLSEGNPGAINVLIMWLQRGKAIDPDCLDPILQLLALDTLDIVGPKIWMLYKDVCDGDLREVIGLIRGWQLGFLTREALTAAILMGTLDEKETVLAQVEQHLPAFQRRERNDNEATQ